MIQDDFGKKLRELNGAVSHPFHLRDAVSF
jgi:hypothetical protein